MPELHVYTDRVKNASAEKKLSMASASDTGLVLSVGAQKRSAWEFVPFAIQRSPNGVGLGGFATRDIAQGECILAEAPLVQCIVPNRKKCRGGDFAALLQEQLAALPDDKKAAYFGLCQLPDGDMAGLPLSIEAAFGIWMTNAYPTSNGPSEGGDGQAVFEKICRLQHSCSPNVNLAWNAERGAQTAYACCPIRQGEELTVAYWGDECCGVLRAERQRRMLERFGFECACVRCRLTDAALAASDQRQRKLGVLAGLIESDRDGGVAELPKHVTALVDLLREEGMPMQWGERYLLAAALRARRSGDQAAAREWATQAAACAREAAGEDSHTYCSIVDAHLRSPG